MNKSCIVTGGAGFIGSNLVQALNARGVENILIVDTLGRGEKWRNLIDLRYEDIVPKQRFIEYVSDKGLPDAEAVFHLGACSATTETDADYLLENNYRYTRTLCDACLQSGARFIYASSAATYGDGAQGYRDDHESVADLRPMNMYGYSKQMFDLWALRTGALDRIAGLKYFNVYGPRETHKGDMRSMVHKAFEQIRDTGRVKLFKSHRPDYKDGEQVRDFIYIDEAVDKTLFFLDRRDVHGLFNVGSGAARSWNDLARAVFDALGKTPRIEYVDMPEAIRESYQYYTRAEVDKLVAAGCDAAPVSLEEGVARYVRDLTDCVSKSIPAPSAVGPETPRAPGQCPP